MLDILASTFPAANRPGDAITHALETVRGHLPTDIAYVSEFVDHRSVFRNVDPANLEAIIAVGDSESLEDVYCRQILEGRWSQLMPDTANYPLKKRMPITDAVPIGSHMSVPLRLKTPETRLSSAA